MLKLYTEGHDNVKPDGVSLTTVISAYTQPPLTLTEEILGYFEDIIDLLLNKSGDFPHTDPDTVVKAFNTIIDNIAKSDTIDNAGERANHFLQKLLDASSLQMQLRPNSTTYSNVIGAYVKDDDIEKALSMLDQMIDGDLQYLRSAFSFNKCLNYYCKKRDIEAAEDLYKTMTDLAKADHDKTSINESSVVDKTTYNMMMDMYLNMGSDTDSKMVTDKAIKLLEESEDAYKSGIIKSLDMFLFEAVLERLQKRSLEKMKSGISEKSYDLLMKMIDHHFNRHLAHHPDRLTFNLVLSTLARECTEEAAKKAMVSFYFLLWKCFFTRRYYLNSFVL